MLLINHTSLEVLIPSMNLFIHMHVYIYIYYLIRAELARDYPLNLSILVRGGEGTNKDSLSNGE